MTLSCPPGRRTQAQRTGDARRRVIAAAVSCLDCKGYAATTIADIAAHAGLSKGAVMHHFPDKVAIMAAVADQVFVDELATYQTAIANRKPGLSPLEALVEAGWSHYQRPEAMAVLEIWMATRSDLALAASVGPVFDAIKAQGEEHADAIMESSDAPNGAAARGLQTLMLAAMRGLAIERALTADPSVHEAAALLMAFARQVQRTGQ
ncbi:MAG: TetR/AcrR family transcriptional regulator [Alphaproteobacteria bacterium]|nr:TetR/AcrR family transcriptional regulator [Alphaproteobacteria bacterium]